MSTSDEPRTGVGEVTAQLTLVLAPLLAFDAFRLPGIYTLAMTIPLLVLGAAYLRTPGLRVPGWELAFIGLLLGSVLWAEDPAYTVERMRTYGPLTLAVVLAGCLLTSDVVLRSLKISFAVLVGSSVLFMVADPSGRRRDGELLLHGQFGKNEFGGLLLFALVLLLGRFSKAHLALMVPLVVMIALNRSVTAYVVTVALVVVAAITGFLFKRLPPASARPLVLVTTGVLVGAFALVLPFIRVQALLAVGKSSTLSSRTHIWAGAWRQIVKSPLLGYGAFDFLERGSHSLSSQAVTSEFRKYSPPHPHNGALDVLGQLGVVGLATFVCLVVAAFVAGSRAVSWGDEAARVGLLGLAFIVLFGITEPTFLGPYLVLTLACTAMAHPRRGTPPTPTASTGPPRVLSRT